MSAPHTVPFPQGGLTFHRSERTTGRQWRNLQLPAYADAHAISASLEHGLLTVTMPKMTGAEAGA